MIDNIFDSHAHYDHQDFNDDRDSVLSNMKKNGVSLILNSASSIPTSINAVNLAKKYPFIYASVGIHPQDAQTFDNNTLAQLQDFLTFEKTVAIGEIGLDYHYDEPSRDLQKMVFEKQLCFAKKHDMPVIIHSRDACEDTLFLLKKYKPTGVVHCFSGSVETAQEILKLGMYIGFTGVVTFKNAKRALEVAQVVPLDKLVVETDCPYMAPVPFRGKRCDSTMLHHTLEALAQIMKLDPQMLANITKNNALNLFRIKV